MTEFTLTCTRCKKLKPDDGFRMCGKCRALMRGQYHRLRRDKERARHEWMNRMKAKMSCHDCGASYPEDPSRLAWDHLPGFEKIANVSDMVAKGLVEEVLEEIKKCHLVCQPCHLQRGLQRGQIPTGPQTIGHCGYCQQEFRYQACRKRRFCSQQCSAASRRKLRIHYWRPPKPRYVSQPPWWETVTIYDMQDNVVELPKGSHAVTI